MLIYGLKNCDYLAARRFKALPDAQLVAVRKTVSPPSCWPRPWPALAQHLCEHAFHHMRESGRCEPRLRSA